MIPSCWRSTPTSCAIFAATVQHPSTMQIMDELGLLQEFLKRPHQKMTKLGGEFGGVRLRVADFTHVKAVARLSPSCRNGTFWISSRMPGEAISQPEDFETHRSRRSHVEGRHGDRRHRADARGRASRHRRSHHRLRWPAFDWRAGAQACRSRTSVRRWTCSGSASARAGQRSTRRFSSREERAADHASTAAIIGNAPL